MMLRLTAILLLAAAAGACGSSAPEPTATPKGEPATSLGLFPQGRYDSPPRMTIDPNSHYVATLETERGDIVIQLFSKEAPMTVNNFVFLAREGFYDGSTFHRVIAGFMAQGGIPSGGGPVGTDPTGPAPTSSIRSCGTTPPASCPWSTQEPTPTGASSS